MFVFGTGGTGPRPESYREDKEMAEMVGKGDPKVMENFYFHMKAGAESGWDYSTRWMINEQASIQLNFIQLPLVSFSSAMTTEMREVSYE